MAWRPDRRSSVESRDICHVECGIKRAEGLGLRATARVLGAHKNTLTHWETRCAAQKKPLMLHARCHAFIQLTFESGDLHG